MSHYFFNFIGSPIPAFLKNHDSVKYLTDFFYHKLTLQLTQSLNNGQFDDFLKIPLKF